MGGEVGEKCGARQRLKPGAQPRSSQSLVLLLLPSCCDAWIGEMRAYLLCSNCYGLGYSMRACCFRQQ